MDTTTEQRISELAARVEGHLMAHAALEAIGQETIAEIEALANQAARAKACPQDHRAWAQMVPGAYQRGGSPQKRVLGRYYRCKLCGRYCLRRLSRAEVVRRKRRARKLAGLVRIRMGRLLPIVHLPHGAQLWHRLSPAGAHGAALLELRVVLGDGLLLCDFDPEIRAFVVLPRTWRARTKGDLDGWSRWGSPAQMSAHADLLARAKEATGYVT